MATIRSSSGSSSISAFSSVVLPEPVPPETRMFRREREQCRSAARNTVSGRAPWPTRSSAENARPPNRRMVIATWGFAGGVHMATLEPSSSRASRTGRVAGSSPSGLRDVDRRPVERGGGERWRLDGLELPAALDPDIAGAVDHQLGDLRIFEHGLESGQERLQVPDPARALHSRPSSRRRQ